MKTEEKRTEKDQSDVLNKSQGSEISKPVATNQQFLRVCQENQLEKVSACLTLGASVGAVSEALRVDCEAGNSALVSLLVKVEGVEVNCPDERGWTGAHHASYGGHTECLTILEQLESVDWRRRNSDGLSPLHYFKHQQT